MLLVFCIIVSVAQQCLCEAEELSIKNQDGDILLLDGFASHKEFCDKLLQRIGMKIQTGTNSFLRYSKISSDQFLSNIDSSQYLFFQLMHALYSGDKILTNQLLEETEDIKQVLNDWIKSNVQIPNEDSYKIIESIVHSKERGLSDIPDSVVNEILQMTNKSEVFTESCKRGDDRMIQWFFQYGVDFDLSEPLEIAGEKGNWNVVKILISKGGLNPGKIHHKFSTKPNGTVLLLAASFGSPEAVGFLLDAGVPIDGVDVSGASPLYSAISNSNIDTAGILTENNADVSLKTASGNTALHAAALNGNLAAVQLLLNADASVIEKNNLGLTPLDIADQSGIFYVLKYLLQNDIKLPSSLLLDSEIIPFLYFFSEHGKHSPETKPEKIENYCEIVQLMNDRTNHLPYKKEVKTKLLKLVIKNRIVFLTKCLIDLGADLKTVNRNKETLLFNAVRVGSYEIVRLFLNEAVEINTKNVNGTTPLHLAARHGSLDIVGLLLKRGAIINAVSNNGYTALHFASKEGHLMVANHLLSKGITLNVTRKSDKTLQETPLQLAATYGNLNIVKKYLAKNIFNDIKSNETWNTMHSAAKAGHYNIVNYLLDKGYDVDVADSQSKTPLWWASYGGSVPTVNTLIKRGASLNQRSSHESSGPLAILLNKCNSWETPLHIAALKGHKEVCEILLEKGLDINSRDDVNKTPLYNAAENGHFDVVKFLLEKKADKNLKTAVGATPLHAAAAGGHVDITNLLIDKGMDIDVTADHAQTPLYYAAKAGKIESVKNLIEKLAEVNSSKSSAPLFAAVKYDHYDVALLLIKNGANVEVTDKEGNNLYMIAIMNQNSDMLNLLHKRGLSPNQESERRDKKRALHLAARINNPSMVQLLLKHQVLMYPQDADGTTALFDAVEYNNEDVVALLFASSVDPDSNISRDSDKFSCLHMAVMKRSVKNINLLLDENADINALTIQKYTPLHLAVYDNNYEVSNLLIKRGADVNIKDYKGQLPYDIALRKNYTEILKLRLCDCYTKKNPLKE